MNTPLRILQPVRIVLFAGLLLLTSQAFAQVVTISANTDGQPASPLLAGRTNVVILGMTLNKDNTGATTLTSLKVNFDSNPTGKYTNPRLVRSTNAVYGDGDDTAPITASFSGNSVTFTDSPIFSFGGSAAAATRSVFILVDVASSVTTATAAIKATSGTADVTTSSGTLAGSAVDGPSYTFTEPIITVASLSGGIAPSPLGSGTTDKALLGFSISSTGSPNFTDVVINTSSNPAGKISNIRLFSSSNNSFGGGDTDLGITPTVNATSITFAGLAQALSSSNKFYFVVADIGTGVSASTPTLQLSFDQSDVTVSTGTVSAVTITGIDYSFADADPPGISSTTPADNATGVLVSTTSIQVTFDENVVLIAGYGTDDDHRIRIKDIAANTYATIPVGNISITGATVTITISALTAGKDYAVRIGDEVFEDAVGNDFPGITNDTDWNFKMESGPDITGYSVAATCIGESINITGTNFGAAVPTVTVNGTAATVTANSATSITVTIPTTTTGTATIVVTNNNNSLSDSDTNLTLKPAIATSLGLSSTPSAPSAGQNYSIDVLNSQTTVSYRVRELPAAFSGGTTNGNGGTLSLGSFSNSAPSGYQYEVQASSAGCTSRVYGPLTITIAAINADAGVDKAICSGDNTTIGGAPTASGGTGFFQISWTGPGGFTSSLPNPSVSVAGTYTVTVKDNSGATDTDGVNVVVNAKPIVGFVPSGSDVQVKTQFGDTESPYELNGNPTPGAIGVFSGLAVSKHANGKWYFDPAIAGVQSNIPLTYSYTDANGCTNSATISVSVFSSSSLVNGLDEAYCANGGLSSQLSVNMARIPPPGFFTYTYSRMAVYHPLYGFIPPGHPNNPLIEDVGSNPKTYHLDPVKLATFGATSDFYVYVYAMFTYIGNLNPPSEIIFSSQNSRILATGEIPEITSIKDQQNICSYAGDVVLMSNLDGKYTTTNYSINDGGVNSITTNGSQYVFDPSAITYAPGQAQKPLTITFTYEDANTPIHCSGTATRDFFMIQPVELPVADNKQYCQFFEGQRVLNVSSNAGSKDFRWYETFSLTDPPVQGPVFDTKVSSQNPFTKSFYVTQTLFGCESSARTVDIEITPAPSINLNIPPQCENREFTYEGPTTNAVSWEWNFGEDATTYTTQSVDYTYKNQGVYYLSLLVKSNTNGQECSASTTIPVTVGLNPKPSFTFSQVCDGDNTQFEGTANIAVQKYAWRFTKAPGNEVGPGNAGDAIVAPDNNGGKTGGTYKSPTHKYLGGPQSDTVTLIAYTNLGCYDSIRRKISILPLLQYDDNNPYVMADLDGGKGFWDVEDFNGNSTWEFAPPAEANIHSPLPAWTNDADGNYLNNDLSYVNGPCMNIENISRPVLTLDMMADIEKGADGAALQYSTDGATWSNLGLVSSGKNWYNDNGIPFGNGATQAWSGSLASPTKSWLEAKHVLNEIPVRSKVRFRVAFYSDIRKPMEGFAFRNVRIEPRNRTMLAENFTNNGATDGPANNTQFYQATLADFVRIEYHTSFPANDDINNQNAADHNSRAAFYGITNTNALVPRVFADGTSEGNLKAGAWFVSRSSLQALESSPLDITLGTLPGAGAGVLSVKATIKTRQKLRGKPLVFIAVVEKTVGANQFVMRKLLPSAAGTPIPANIMDTPGATFDVTENWIPRGITDINNLAIAVFVQDENTKEVHQAAYLAAPGNLPGAVTAIEPTFADQIAIYPNPAAGEVHIRLPRQVNHTLPFTLIDNFGREVYQQSFQTGELLKTIDTQHWADGVYILQIKGGDGVTARKKLVITNR